ncbi:hypothetical protein M9458_024817, partial [Cirrhinus mrigala]
MEMEMKVLVRMTVTSPSTPAITIPRWTKPGEPQTTPPRKLFGWYRLFYRGKPIQMPERCVKKEMCGTHAPLWLVGTHPRIRDGVVTRKVCGHWKNNCCLFQSPPIQVKACRGNYYVY